VIAAEVAIRYRAATGGREGVITHGPRRDAVALTFDDGPCPIHTQRVLEILKAYGARATFFVLAARVAANEDLARRVAAEHEIGCHSFDHAPDVTATLQRFRADLARCRPPLARIGVTPSFYRFPWGRPGRVAPRDVATLEAMRCVHWSASSGDDTLDASGIVRRLSTRVGPGAVVLFHDGVAPGSVRRNNRAATIDALPRVLEMLDRRGLRACAVGDLLHS
jgi:peptidoglycan/xylan/chitin deacetylase (PgdA/CDA1 family)